MFSPARIRQVVWRLKTVSAINNSFVALLAVVFLVNPEIDDVFEILSIFLSHFLRSAAVPQRTV